MNLNLYAYAANNPVMMKDTDGRHNRRSRERDKKKNSRNNDKDSKSTKVATCSFCNKGVAGITMRLEIIPGLGEGAGGGGAPITAAQVSAISAGIAAIAISVNGSKKSATKGSSLSNQETTTAAPTPGGPDDEDKYTAPNKAKKGDRIDLNRFQKTNNRPKNFQGKAKKALYQDPKSEYYIQRDIAGPRSHASDWKLFNSRGQRLGTLNEYGVFLR